MDDVIAALPDKGKKRVNAIFELGNNEVNAGALMTLAETEKGECKTAALKTLALFDYKPAAHLWKKLITGKYMGESILMPSCSDCVSEQAAPEIQQFFSSLFELSLGTVLTPKQYEKFMLCISIMLGKATDNMLDIYRFAAVKAEWLQNMKKEALYHGNRKLDFWHFNDYLKIWDATPDDLEKIFPAVLTASIIKSMDTRLMALADELFAKHEGCWLIPVFVKAILTKTKEDVFSEYSKFLSDTKMSVYLYNALGVLYYEDAPKGFEKMLEVQGLRKGYYALIFWGNYSYGTYDTRCHFKQPVDLDERWLFCLAENPQAVKPKVALQTYNRRMIKLKKGGVKFEAYDEMLLELLPLEMEAGKLKQVLADYFLERSKKDDGKTSVYEDALKRFMK